MMTRYNQFYILAFLTLLTTVGCAPAASSRNATVQDVEAVVKLLRKELQQYSGFHEAGGKSDSANVKSRDVTFLLDAESCSPEDVANVTEKVFTGYIKAASFSSRGHGRTGNRLRMRFGNEESHVFLDVLAYAQESTTNVVCLIRAVE